MGLLLVLVFVALLIFGTPIPFALGFSSLLVLLSGGYDLILVPQRIITGTDSFTLLAIPFFVMAGELMRRGGLSKRLVYLANSIIGHVTGGLASVTVIASMFFGAISGSAPATTAAIGSIMIPEMEQKGYSRDFSAALASASGPMGHLIPPSIPMIVWGVVANVSITRLFLAGIIPGILMGFALIFVSYLVVMKKGITLEKKASLSQVLGAFKDSFWALLAPLIILGGIYGGVFTPTEAAAIAVVYGFIVGKFIYKDLNIKDMPEILIGTVKTTTIVMFIISVASLFGWIIAREQVAQVIVNNILSITTNEIIILLMMNLTLLIIGCLMDNIGAMVILSSVLTSIALQLGIDPVQFGAIVVINFAIGQATPPLGYSLFVGSSISGVSMERISRAIWPLLLSMIAVLMLLTFIPAITLFLPNLLMN